MSCGAPQVEGGQFGAQPAVGAALAFDTAADEDGRVVGDAEDRGRELLDDQDRDALPGDLCDLLVEAGGGQRGGPHGEVVPEEDGGGGGPGRGAGGGAAFSP